MVYKLRAHHIKNIYKLLKMNVFRMFLSNLIWYGYKEAKLRYALLRKIRNDKHAKFKLVDGREDEICKQCKHFRYCNTNFDY